MAARLWWSLALFLLLPMDAGAQVQPVAGGLPRVLVLEHLFTAGSTETVTVRLERRVKYWVTLSGPGTPEFLQTRRYHPPALVAPVGPSGPGAAGEFEVYPAETGVHVIRLTGLTPGSQVTIRVYRDDFETERMASLHDHDFAVGLYLGGGLHSGYRLDPTGGDPATHGSDLEGCLLADTGHWFSTCIGAGRQTLPSADLTLTWFFIEPRARVYSGHLVGDHRFDLGASVRVAQSPETGARHISPSLLAVGVYVVQHLSPNLRQRGWSIYAAWQHGRLGNVPETEDRDNNRLTAGLTWVP
jgi:hypothetical protein